MSKFLIVTFSDNRSYKIPLVHIAAVRAKYYSEIDHLRYGQLNIDNLFQDEFQYGLENENELIDYAFNNMDWSDVSSFAIEIRRDHPIPDYEKEWTNVEHQIEEL